jgi:hypothetical protein
MDNAGSAQDGKRMRANVRLWPFVSAGIDLMLVAAALACVWRGDLVVAALLAIASVLRELVGVLSKRFEAP